LVSELS